MSKPVDKILVFLLVNLEFIWSSQMLREHSVCYMVSQLIYELIVSSLPLSINLLRVWFRKVFDLLRVRFRQVFDLLRVRFRQVFDLLRIWFRQVFNLLRVWFRQVFDLVRVWFRQVFDLLRVWFRQVSLYKMSFSVCSIRTSSSSQVGKLTMSEKTILQSDSGNDNVSM